MLRSKQQFWRIILSRFLSTYSLLTTSLSSTHTAEGGGCGDLWAEGGKLERLEVLIRRCPRLKTGRNRAIERDTVRWENDPGLLLFLLEPGSSSFAGATVASRVEIH